MPRIRHKNAKNYTVLSNQLARDRRLSYKARGLFLYLWSLSDDWEISLRDMETHSEKDGQNSVRTGIQELQDAGYVSFERSTAKQSGKFLGTVWTLDDRPPCLDFPNVDNPTLENPNDIRSIFSEEVTQTKDKIKERINTSARTPAPKALDNPLCAKTRAKRRARSSGPRAKFLTGTGLAQEELVTEVIAAFYDTYAEEKGTSHHAPLVPALTAVYQELDAACPEHALSTIDGWYPLIAQFFRRAAVPKGKFTSNGHLEHFATEGVLKYLAYQCGELAGYESEGD